MQSQEFAVLSLSLRKDWIQPSGQCEKGQECLKCPGYTSVVLKTDQETALRVVMDKIRTHRGDQTQTMSELSPVCDSKSNGLIERAIQTVKGQVRTMRCALEASMGRKLINGGALFSWLVIHAANVINLFEVGRDAKFLVKGSEEGSCIQI